MYIHIRAHRKWVCAWAYISAWASVLLVQVIGNSRALRCGTATVQSRFFVYILQTMRIKNIFHKEKLFEFLRFCFVGVLATGIHYGIYLLLIKTSSLEGQFWINAAYLTLFIIAMPFLPQKFPTTIVPLALALWLCSVGHIYLYKKKENKNTEKEN